MKKITAAEFYRMIAKNPSVFKNWDTPLAIKGYVKCKKSEITHLSKHLTFLGKNIDGSSADFTLCKKLKAATGTFHGCVWFTDSDIEKIENLTVTNSDNKGGSASFHGCKNLKIATGNYAGFVSFSESGIHSIQNLQIKIPRIDNTYAAFKNCPNLSTLENWDLSKQIWVEEEKLEAEIKRRASLKKYLQETQPQELPFL
jgi:hypothetical protein